LIESFEQLSSLTGICWVIDADPCNVARKQVSNGIRWASLWLAGYTDNTAVSSESNYKSVRHKMLFWGGSRMPLTSQFLMNKEITIR